MVDVRFTERINDNLILPVDFIILHVNEHRRGASDRPVK